jgi:thiol-disulfide isomerase/thioredoxin
MKTAILMLLCSSAFAQEMHGLWDAVLIADGRSVGFRIEFSGSQAELTGSILDGEQRISSTSGSLRGNKVTLRWDYFDSILEATLGNGGLRGAYTRRKRDGLHRYEFSAKPFKAETAGGKADVDVSGDWILTPERARRSGSMGARFRQSGREVSGTIQRVDGDFGTLQGQVEGHAVHLSHFDGIRMTSVDLTLEAPDKMSGVIDGTTKFAGVRAAEAARFKVPEPPDPSRYTNVADPSQPFTFRFQDLDGYWVSSEDARFRDKALIVTILGSWCPNCHDEAPFLVELYRKYHERGLEIVALGFEYTGEVDHDREQLRAFVRRHTIPYTVLLAGTTEDGDVQRKLPQIRGFGAFPTTFFLDRAHRVRAVHAGFSGPATGAAYTRLREETTKLVEGMLVASAR